MERRSRRLVHFDMVDVRETVCFASCERTLRLMMDIAVALERYRIVMEGPAFGDHWKLVGFEP